MVLGEHNKSYQTCGQVLDNRSEHQYISVEKSMTIFNHLNELSDESCEYNEKLFENVALAHNGSTVSGKSESLVGSNKHANDTVTTNIDAKNAEILCNDMSVNHMTAEPMIQEVRL